MRYVFCFLLLGSATAQSIEFEDPNLEEALLDAFWLDESTSLPVDSNGDRRISVQEALEVTGSLSLVNKSILSLEGMHHFVNIGSISIIGNQIKTLAPLGGLNVLKDLFASSNPISNLEGVPSNIERLVLGFCNIGGSVDVGGFASLAHVDLIGNEIVEFKALGLKQLDYLRLSGNWLEDVMIDQSTPLIRVFLSENNFRSIPTLPPSVEILDLSFNDFTDLAGMPLNLRVLDVEGNHVQDDQFVADYPHLVSLVIADNSLTSISNIARHPTLGTSLGINCSGIPIGCSEFHYLNLAGNYLSLDDCNQLQTIIEKAPNPLFPEFGFDAISSCSSQQDVQWIPHLTRVDGGFDTEMVLFNQGSETVVTSIFFFDESGALVSTETVTLGAMGSSTLALDPLASHASMTDHPDITLTLSYRSLSAGSAAAFVASTSRFGHRFWVRTGDWPTTFDGLAVVNLGDDESTIAAEFFDLSFNPMIAQTVLGTIGPHAKLLYVLNEISQTEASYVKVSSTQPAVAVFLRGTPPQVTPGYLFENPMLRVE